MNKEKPYTMPAHEHIRLKESGITYNDDHSLKQRPFNTPEMKQLRKEILKRG